MIQQNVIKRRADEDELPAPAVERDYVLAHVLTAISERDTEKQLVFKGGTSLGRALGQRADRVHRLASRVRRRLALGQA